MTDAALLTRGLTKRYGDVEAVSELDLRIERGELYGFLGPNGAGKTTTIRMALGLIHPTRGDVHLLGGESSRDVAHALRRTGAMIEEPSFYRFLSARRNLQAFPKAGRDRADERPRPRRHARDPRASAIARQRRDIGVRVEPPARGGGGRLRSGRRPDGRAPRRRGSAVGSARQRPSDASPRGRRRGPCHAGPVDDLRRGGDRHARSPTGTLRSLLVRPVERPRLVGAKYVSALVLLGAVLLAVVVAGLIAGAVFFGLAPLPMLSGSTLPVGAAVAGIVGAGLYILLAACGVTAIGVFLSTLTDSGPGAIVATVVLVIASQVLDQIPSLHAIHPFLPIHGWLGYADLFRFPVEWAAMRAGIVVSAAYAIVFLGAAFAWFGRKDVMA